MSKVWPLLMKACPATPLKLEGELRVVSRNDANIPKIDLSVKTLLRGPEGNDKELLGIFLKYNDVLMKRGIGSFNIWMKRAYYLHGLGRYEEAIDAVQEALVHEPHDADAHFHMGVCLQLLALEENGDSFEHVKEDTLKLLKTAALAFEAALELNPQDPEAESHLTNLRCLIYTPTGLPKVETVDVDLDGALDVPPELADDAVWDGVSVLDEAPSHGLGLGADRDPDEGDLSSAVA